MSLEAAVDDRALVLSLSGSVPTAIRVNESGTKDAILKQGWFTLGFIVMALTALNIGFLATPPRDSPSEIRITRSSLVISLVEVVTLTYLYLKALCVALVGGTEFGSSLTAGERAGRFLFVLSLSQRTRLTRME